MRQTCQISWKIGDGKASEPCDKPAVDFVERKNEDGDPYKFWLCAEHFDLMQRIHAILKRVSQEREDY